MKKTGEGMESASTSTVVSIDGGTLASLLFKLKNSHGDAEGFLVGEVCRRCVDAITDSQSAGIREEKKLRVLSFIIFNKRFRFYDHFGRPDLASIQTILGSQYKHLIGWFSYRCNTSHRISLRERSAHRKLLEKLTDVVNIDFLFGLITEGLLEQTPIQSTEYSFHTWNGSFRSMGVEVVNLRASGTVPYQTMAISPDLVHDSEYAAILQSQSSLFMSPDGKVLQATTVEGLYRTMLNRLEPLLSKLTDSNTEIIALDQEVTRLQELADELQREKSEKKPLKEDGSIHTNNEATNIKPINLIDLNSPRDGDKNLCTPREQSVDIEPPIISHDILSESILESSLNLQAELLQPLVVEDKEETTSGSSRHEPNSSFIQQSQELF
ncbi:BRCA1-A complex subunit Abraxas 1-like [Halichondria panicea]|uniref:BRCA1-A complex subunit Abraxas 1-like n=1 Tax=Halichondria panicea TaxID=6063 RepID=UPI00312B54E1